MRRRNFLRGAAAAGGLTALAGCSIPFLGGNPAPPRKSNVIEKVSMQSNAMTVDLADEPMVESRKEADAPKADLAALNLDALSPVGVAAAKGKGGGAGKGATGRGSGGYRSAPKTSKGRAKYHGGAYASSWRKKHDDEIQRYRAAIAAVAIGYMGSNAEFQDDKPPSGPLDDWDRKIEDPSKDQMTFQVSQEGWYRVGTLLESPDGGTVFGWECVDIRVESGSSGMQVEEKWKVSPRL